MQNRNRPSSYANATNAVEEPEDGYDCPLADHHRGSIYFSRELYDLLPVSQKKSFFADFQVQYADRMALMKTLQVKRRSTIDLEEHERIDSEYAQFQSQNDEILKLRLVSLEILPTVQ